MLEKFEVFLQTKSEEEPKVEEVPAEGAKTEEVPEVPDAAAVAEKLAEGMNKGLNRGEKKCRKALQKLGMKEMTGFTRVALRKRDGVIFIMNDPDVFKSSESSYVCFGELKIDDPNQRLPQMEANKFSDQQQQIAAAQAMAAQQQNPVEETKKVAESNEAPESEEGITASHIDMVMNHASCSRNEAIRALRTANDDMIAAVMQLTQ